MGLLDLIEQHYRVRLAAHGLGKLATLVVAYVSWRRTNQSAHAVFLLILAHVDTRHHGLVVKQIVGQGFGKLCFTYTCGTKEDEAGDRTLRILQASTTTAHSIRYGNDGFVLTNHTLVQLIL